MRAECIGQRLEEVPGLPLMHDYGCSQGSDWVRVRAMGRARVPVTRVRVLDPG